MRKVSLIALVGVLTLVIGGCSLFEKKSEDAEETTQQTQPAAPNSPALQAQIGQSVGSSTVGGLIPPINPAQRKTTIKQGRSDPFALIPVQPQVKVNPDKTGASGESAYPQALGQPLSSQPSVAQKPPNSSKPIKPLAPPPPEPELAQAVAVTGVIEVGGVKQAIVKAPNERFSRYVQQGQFLANGQVLVKRIDLYPVPVVVFEELGIEVYKEVGEGIEAPATEQAQGTSTQV